MINSRIASVVGLMSVLAVSGFGSRVIAQGTLVAGGRQSGFGIQELAPRFMPDPININVLSGGNLDVSTMHLGRGCIGYVTAQPTFIVRTTGNLPLLRVYVTVTGARGMSAGDTSLVVNTANARWRCNDDSFGSANPTVDIENAGPGQYDIWVGSYRDDAQVRAVLHITELSANHP